MNKKTYMTPEVEVTEFASQVLMSAASQLNTLNDEGGEEQSLGNDRRGTWGNLWN